MIIMLLIANSLWLWYKVDLATRVQCTKPRPLGTTRDNLDFSGTRQSVMTVLACFWEWTQWNYDWDCSCYKHNSVIYQGHGLFSGN